MTRLLSLVATVGLALCVWLARPAAWSDRWLRVAWLAGRWARRIDRWSRWRAEPLDTPRPYWLTDVGGMVGAREGAPIGLDTDGEDTCGGGGWDPPCGGCDLCIVRQAAYYKNELNERPVALVWRRS